MHAPARRACSRAPKPCNTFTPRSELSTRARMRHTLEVMVETSTATPRMSSHACALHPRASSQLSSSRDCEGPESAPMGKAAMKGRAQPRVMRRRKCTMAFCTTGWCRCVIVQMAKLTLAATPTLAIAYAVRRTPRGMAACSTSSHDSPLRPSSHKHVALSTHVPCPLHVRTTRVPFLHSSAAARARLGHDKEGIDRPLPPPSTFRVSNHACF